MERPYTDRKLNKRESVRYWRRQKAWDLANKLGEVTEESYEQAYKLLDSCKNLALAFARLDERESEFNWKGLARKRDKLIVRMERLDERLKPYGCKIDRAWGIENVYDYDFERHIPLGNSYLHFFD